MRRRAQAEVMGTLYLVATPIGNLEDISARALRVLREVPLIAAEDTRHTGRLLRHFEISTPLVSYHAHNERSRREQLLESLASGDLALVTDAGSPGISDPGHDLVEAAAAAGFSISAVPGPSALIAAVGVSGLVPGPFLALGFLPRRGPERRIAIGHAASSPYPVVLFEAPSRVGSTLAELAQVLGDRRATVSRELTKVHEETRRGSLSALAASYAGQEVRGEVVVVVGAPEATGAGEDDARSILMGLLKAGLGPSQAAREAAAITGLPRASLYDQARQLRNSGPDLKDTGSG